MASVSDALAAIRRGAARSRRPDAGVLRVGGPDGLDLLDRALPSELFIRQRAARQSLLLDEDGRVLADLLLLADGDDMVLISEGMGADALAARLRDLARPGERVELRPLNEVTVLDLDGPFAWQVLGDLAGEGPQGMRLFTWFPFEGDTLCVRAGQTGEFGYRFAVPARKAEDLYARLGALGEAVDMAEAPPEAIARARLEAWVFDLRRQPLACPLEWGLQWRLLLDKDYPGVEALRARRGQTRRAVAFRAEAPVAPGAVVEAEGEPIGVVAACDALGGEVIGAALLDPFTAHAGVQGYTAGGMPIATVSPPFVRAMSLLGAARAGRYRRPT